MKKLLFTLTLLSVFVAFSQQEASNWYFGDNAGISFDLTGGTVSFALDGQLGTVEGCTTISDTSGNLLLYTDGTTVYNANHSVMQNGNGLKGDESSSQSAIVVPKPGDPNIYYIFTVASNQNPQGIGMYYSEVDISLNGGAGAVTANKNISLLSGCAEKLSAVLKDCVTGAIWVITLSNHSGSSNTGMNSFHAFEITNAGINLTPVVSTLPITINDPRGNLKFSPDATRLAAANAQGGLFIANFDKETGIVSNPQALDINTPQNNIPYGVEFSPNSQLLYVTSSNDFFQDGSEDPTNHSASLVQFDLNANNIENSQVTIDERQLYRGGLQLGPDGRIYRALSATYNQGIPSLAIINNPNVIGTGCDYQHLGIGLSGRASRQGLPPFIQSFFTQQIDIIQNGVNTQELSLCEGDTYTLMADDIPGAVYSWTMNGAPLSETDFDLIVYENGTYEVSIVNNSGDCGILEGIAIVSYFEVPSVNQPSDMLVCDDDDDGIYNFNLSSQTSDIIGAQDPMLFEIKYFATLTDADANINELPATYQNTSNPQLIYARIHNMDNTNCHNITTFNIQVFTPSTVASTSSLSICDNDANAMDGHTDIDLSNLDPEVLGTLDPAQFTVTYHSSQNDADAGINPLPIPYNNPTPFAETIYVRIENNLNTDCYATDSLVININPIPEAFDVDLYQCDEEGNVDGFTTFNLIEANEALTGNTPDRSTQFYLSLNDAQDDLNPVNESSYNNTSNPQVLYVKVTNDLTGCVNYSELTLEVSNTQINDYSAPEVCDELNSEDGINTFNLNDFSSEILNGLPDGLDINYYETYDNALLEQNELDLTYENTIPYSQTIYVRVENDNACYGINEVLLTVNPLPQLGNDETILYCLNEFPSLMTLESGIDSSQNNYNYSWSNGEDTQSIMVNEIGTYTVTATNSITGCSQTRTITLEPSNVATIENIDIIDGSLNNNQITIITSGEGEYEYALVNQDGDSTPYQSSPVFTNISPGFYSILIRDIKNNCGITNTMVSVIGFPLYFTPNGDGINDTWQVYGISSNFQSNSKTYIFDRYGKLITQIDTASRGWDGTYNGKPLPESDYWFSVTLQDGRIYKDHFTLKR